MRTTTKPIVTNSVITILVVLIFALFSLNSFYRQGLNEEHKDLEKCIRTFWELVGHKGQEFRLSGGQLLIGDHVVNGNDEVVDTVQRIFGGVAAIFMGDVLVSTNLLDDSGKRAVGTRLVGPAHNAIFKEGQSYRGEASILGELYLTAYDPIRDGNGDIIGALFVGVKKSSFQEEFNQLRSPVIIALLVLLVCFAIVTLLLQRVTRKLEDAEANALLFLRTLVDTIPSPIFYKDANGRYLGFNKAYETYVGMSQDQMIGKTVFDLWQPDLAEKYHHQDQLLFENCGTQMYEGASVCADGTHHDAIFHKATFHSQSGAVAGLVGVMLDITERKALEDETKNALQQVNDIIEFLPDATFVVDKDKRVIAWNLATEKMTGINKDAVMGQGDYAYALPFYGKRRALLVDLLDSGGEDVDQLYPWVKQVGRTLFTETRIPALGSRAETYLWATAAPLFDKQGNRVGAIESMRDITEHKLIESELRFKNLLQSTQLESSIDGILAVDEHERIFSYNKRFMEIMDIPQSMLDLGDDRPALQAATERAEDPQVFMERVRQIYGQPLKTSRDEVVLKGGVTIDRYSAPMVDDDGRYYGRVWYFRDITEQKHAEEIRLRFEAHRHHSQMIESFITQFGHDLRTPLTPLFALIPLIRQKTDDANVRRMIDICNKSVLTIHELTEKALKLVKLAASTEGKLEHVNLADAVGGFIAENWVNLDRNNLICENGIDRGIMVVVVPDQLRELFSNLISNAARYSNPGGVIRIDALQSGDTLTVAVHDDGIGIEPSDLMRIFDEYYKVDQSRHDVASPGLGLAICKRIIANHHGDIWAESSGKGCGMTVRFTLPTHRGDH